VHKNFGFSSLLDYLNSDSAPSLEIYKFERGSIVVKSVFIRSRLASNLLCYLLAG
jgi:hypothetical protein